MKLDRERWGVAAGVLCLASIAVVLPAWEGEINRDEAKDIIEILAIGPGDSVADVGAGHGDWTFELAERVGNEGQIFATEIKSKLLEEMRDKVTGAGLKNVSVVWGSQYDTGLPSRCCDAVLLRWVYHHFTEPEAMRKSLLRALRPGGRIMIIDFDPTSRDWWKRPDGVPADRGGHGISKRLLIEEMTQAGFEVVQEINSWHGSNYCIIFRMQAPVN